MYWDRKIGIRFIWLRGDVSGGRVLINMAMIIRIQTGI
jgi:hypothetical protein